MTNASQDDPQDRAPVRAFALTLLTAFITAGAVSWVTPDGNLVVTLLPAVVVGEAVYFLTRWWLRRHRAP